MLVLKETFPLSLTVMSYGLYKWAPVRAYTKSLWGPNSLDVATTLYATYSLFLAMSGTDIMDHPIPLKPLKSASSK